MRLVSDATLATICIWQEARGEMHEGQIAVGEVIRNRMKKRGQAIAQVVLAPHQFNGFDTYGPGRVLSFQLDDMDPVVLQCATAWLDSESSNLTNGATHYYNPRLAAPEWGPEMTDVVVIGNHRFGKAP